MPRIQLQDPFGLGYTITTRKPIILSIWFDEILPHTWVSGRAGIDDFKVIWPTIFVSPMWEWEGNQNPDWLTDTRVMGRVQPFPAKDGISGMKELENYRKQLEKELEEIKREK
jgi:hypothetical protein